MMRLKEKTKIIALTFTSAAVVLFPFFCVSYDPNVLFLTMPLLDGQNLLNLLDETGRPALVARQTGMQAVGEILFVHHGGIFGTQKDVGILNVIPIILEDRVPLQMLIDPLDLFPTRSQIKILVLVKFVTRQETV